MRQPIEIFCCAAESDRPFLNKLSTQLALKQQHGIIKLWDRAHIMPGVNADEEIRQHLASARIFLLLIGPDFLANDYCYNTVMKAALRRHANREAVIIPVIVRPANWQDVHVLSRIQVLPRDGQPISRQPDQENALWEVAQEIDAAIQRMGEPVSAPNAGPGYRRMPSPQTGNGPDTRMFPMGQPSTTRYQPITGTGKISPPPGQKKIGAILALLAVVIILGGGATFALYARGTSTMTNDSKQQPLSTQVSSTTSDTPAPTAAGAQNTPTTVPASSLSTASLSSPQLPLTIPCVNCPYPQLTVTLNKITVDAPARSTRWVFSFLNNGSNSCSNLNFYPIQLTDSVGADYQGQGQVANSFAISAGQSVQEVSVFTVLPAPGTQYTLELVIYLSGCSPSTSGSYNTYQTENFTFA